MTEHGIVAKAPGQNGYAILPSDVAEGFLRKRPHESPAQRAHRIITTAITEIEHLFWVVGRALVEVHDHELYRDPAIDAASFRAYLAHPDVRLSKSHAYRLMDAARLFRPTCPLDGTLADVPARVTDADLRDMGITRASMVAPRIRAHPEDVEALVADAKALTVLDLELKLRGDAQGTPLNARQEFGVEVGRKLIAIGYRMKEGFDPAAELDEVIALAVDARAQLETLA